MSISPQSGGFQEGAGPGPRERPVAASPSPRRALFRRARQAPSLFSRFFVGESDICVLGACAETTRTQSSAPEDKTKHVSHPAWRKGRVDERDQYRRSRPVDPRGRRSAGAHRRRAGRDRRGHFRSGARRRPDPRDIARGRTRIVDRRAGAGQDQARRDAWESSSASTRCACSSRPI